MKKSPRFMSFAGLLVLLAGSFASPLAIAGDSADSVEKLRKALARTMPSVQPTKISATPIEGLYEVIVGSQVVYMSDDARYMIEGDLYDLKTRRNVSEEAKSSIRVAALKKLGEDKMLVYKPEKVENTITVVTDIDCPYCRRLHSEIPQYMEKNVAVRYVFMPLKGAADMEKTISVWCSDDQQTALDMAKAGAEVEKKECDNPIKQHLQTARELGVRGTPAIILEDGTMLPGYVPVDKLVAEIRK